MTDKEIAERLRKIMADYGDMGELQELADELDPPRPEPGTLVWWSYANDTARKHLGYVSDRQYGVVPLNEKPGFDDYYVPFEQIEWKPARILGLDEVVVKVPPVSEWPGDSETLITLFEGEKRAHRHRDVITRADAARREAEG